MLRSSLFDYSKAFILVEETITVAGAEEDDAAIAIDRNNKHYLKIVLLLPIA